MDCVPYTFCDAVVSTVRDISSLNALLDSANSAFAMWRSALRPHRLNRRMVTLSIGCSDRNRWSYDLITDSQLISFKDLQEIPEKYLQVAVLGFLKNDRPRASSFKEVHAILNFISPFINRTELTLDDIKASSGQITDLLQSVNDAPFGEIELVYYKNEFEEFLRNQINCASLQIFKVSSYNCHVKALDLAAKWKEIEGNR